MYKYLSLKLFLLFCLGFYLPAFSQLCTGSLGDPVVNITFGSGANPGQPLSTIVPGATTTYPFIPVYGNPAAPTVFDGQYTITNNVISHSAWHSGSLDHTPNDVNGYMAFFNASEAPGDFYKQTITGLCGNTRYEMAAWVANVLKPSALLGVKPDITFRIERTDGTLLASYITGPVNQQTNMTWQQFGFFFTTPPGISSVVLKMVNTNIGGTSQPGNDFAIDDITFRPCGPSLNASFSSTSSEILKTQCGFAPVPLFGTASAGYSSPSYLWQLSTNGITWVDLPNSNNINYNYTPTALGTHYLRLLSGEGTNINSLSCRVASNQVILNITSPPQIAFSGNTICPGQQGQLAFQITGGSGAYNVVIHDGINNIVMNSISGNSVINITPNPAATTTYTLISVADVTGCIRSSGFSNSTATITVLPASNSLCNTQNVIPNFTIPDTVCVNNPVTINNTSTGASSFFWNFCVANLNNNPTGSNIGNPSGRLAAPVFMDYALYNGNYYGFVVNHSPGGLVRLDYGNSLLNAPTAVNLGNFGGALPAVTGSEGIQIVFNENRWYAIIVGGNPVSGYLPRIVKIDFGANLANPTPVATNWGNLGNMLQPIDLHVFKENNNWYGFTVNAENNTITRFNFSSSFNNTPTAVNLGNLGGLIYPTGIHAISDNGFWRVFIVNGGDNGQVGTSSSLTRLDFGSSMLNTPVAVNLGNPGGMLKHPRDLTIMKSCDQIIGFAVNGNPNANDIVKLNFNNNLASTPTTSSLGNLGNLNFPHSISKLFRVNEDIYGFITNVANNTITRLRFSGCTNASIPNSTLQNPPSVSYNAPGIYNINLTVDDGLPTQNAICKQVVVVPAPAKIPTRTYAICEGDSIRVGTTGGLTTYNWNTGATTDSITIIAAGVYWVDASKFGCGKRDSIIINYKAKPTLSLSPATSICVGDSTPLLANGAINYIWTPATGLSNAGIANPVAAINGTITYVVKGTGANGCTAKDSVTITGKQKPTILSTSDTTLCESGSLQLSASGGSQYVWSPSTGLSDPSIANPIATVNSSITYIVQGTGENGCKAFDTTTITAVTKPVITISRDTSLCQGSSITIVAGGAQQYQWTPASGLSNAGVSNPLATIDTTILYTVKGTSAAGCSSTRSVLLTALAKPNLVANNDTAVCPQSIVQLNASGGSQYQWSPITGLSNATISNPVVTVDSSITYSVTTLAANGCASTKNINLSALAKPIVEARSDTSICGSGTVLLAATGAQQYQWSPATGLSNAAIAQPIATVSGNTKYIVTGTGINGCKAKDSVEISVLQKPVVAVNNDTVICQNKSLQLVASGAQQYVWSPVAGLNNPSIANPVATVNSTIMFTVTGTAANGCSATNTVTLGMEPQPIITLMNDTTICTNGSVTLQASGAQSYQWSPSMWLSNATVANPVATPLTTTMFYLTGSGPNGCQSIDSVLVTVRSASVLSVSPVVGAVCSSNSLQLNASGGNIYLWQPAASLSNAYIPNPLAFPTGNTVYSVRIRDTICNIDSTLTVQVNLHPSPVLSLSVDNDITCSQPSAQIRASGASTYRWSPATGLNNAAIPNPIATVGTTTKYYLDGISAQGCITKDSIEIKFLNSGDLSKLLLPSAFTPNGDGLNDCFGIRKWGNVEVSQFSIFNRWGEIVFQGKSISDCWDGKYKGVPQQSGAFVYILKVKSGCGDVERRGTIVLLR